MVKRTADATLRKLAKVYSIIAVTGPRQSGKTTLAQHVFKNKPYISLEEPDQKLFADEDPRGFLKQFADGAILDEVQRCPQLFSYLQSLVDHDRRPGLFILTGSQQFGLLSNISQTLAGRVGLVQLLPFSLEEIQSAKKSPSTIEDLLFKGLYPPIYDRRIPPSTWYANYVLTYVERDVRQMINVHDLSAFQRFVRMCAARTGQLLNLSSLAADCGITHNTAKAWLSVLEASYIVFLLKPYFRNINKRLIKAPKLYFYDTGMAAWLAGIHDPKLLAIHPMRGALFETWAIGELLKNRLNLGLPANFYFFRDSTGNEVDLVMEDGDKLTPVEIKSGATVTNDYFNGLNYWTKLPLKPSGKEWLIYGGEQRQTRRGVEILPWKLLGKVKPS